jgi:hypothetical protein
LSKDRCLFQIVENTKSARLLNPLFGFVTVTSLLFVGLNVVGRFFVTSDASSILKTADIAMFVIEVVMWIRRVDFYQKKIHETEFFFSGIVCSFNCDLQSPFVTSRSLAVNWLLAMGERGE